MLNITEKDLTKLATINTVSYTKYYADINNLHELVEANNYAKTNNLKLQVIGNGTNIFFSRTQYSNILFIKLKKDFNFFRQNDDFVEIGASFPFLRAGRKLIQQGYEDFAYMCLIPGSLGGGIRQNAGTTNDGEVKKNVMSVKLFDTFDNKVRNFSTKEMNFSYRNSIIQECQGRYIALSAIFSYGKKNDKIESLEFLIKKKRKEKIKKQPSGYSFGSTFKNLELPAWKYLAKLNLCGKAIGGAKFSDKHCNWIINFNQASGMDILKLIEMAKNKVYAELAIELHEEVEQI